jgi:hypothetical protein
MGLLLGILLPACGYRFTAGEGRLANGSSRVVLPVADNRTTEVSAGPFFTEVLRSEAERRGLRVVDAGGGDCVLTSRVVSISSLPRGVAMRGGQFLTREEQLNVRVEFLLKFPDGQENAFSLEAEESYLAALDLRGTLANRELAWKRAMKKLSQRGIETIARGF